MKIAIDARAFSWTGIGRYTRNLLSGLARQASPHEFTVLLSPQDQAAYNQWMETQGVTPFPVVLVEGSYYSWREQTTFWRQVQRLQVDLIHFAHFNVPLLLRRPYVVTIHDVTRFIFPGQRRQDLLQQLAYEIVLKRAVERARGVISMSQATIDDLKQLPVKLPASTQVIYQGLDPVFFDEITLKLRQKVRMLLGTSNPYLLFVGVWMSHKNLTRLLAAHAELVKHYPHLKLVLTGKPRPGYDNMLKLTRQLGIESHVIFAGFVPQELLPALYAEATCFVFPSLYEGFGLPPLEAAACGIPVVAGGVSSVPEVMGEAAYYVNPEDVSDIVRGIQAVMHSDNLRRRLAAAGRARAQEFQWDTAAAAHLAMYELATSQ